MANDTRGKILDTAERLFAKRGIDGVSIRAITGEAKVNLAAIHYHFGSKEAIVKEVFARRIGAVNRDRMGLHEEDTIRSRNSASVSTSVPVRAAAGFVTDARPTSGTVMVVIVPSAKTTAPDSIAVTRTPIAAPAPSSVTSSFCSNIIPVSVLYF